MESVQNLKKRLKSIGNINKITKVPMIKFLMFYTYILKSFINGSYYVGSCKNMNVRFNLHNAGQVVSTKRYIPWELVCKEEYKTLSKARKREMQIKSWKSKIAISKLVKDFKI